ncbi:hypothetical protein C8R44DRAFT_745968 [Mycena epipterygia]|nr:hypothetical protein C8R44DRAFT_745968 [Mycena epipterygia]
MHTKEGEFNGTGAPEAWTTAARLCCQKRDRTNSPAMKKESRERNGAGPKKNKILVAAEAGTSEYISGAEGQATGACNERHSEVCSGEADGISPTLKFVRRGAEMRMAWMQTPITRAFAFCEQYTGISLNETTQTKNQSLEAGPAKGLDVPLPLKGRSDGCGRDWAGSYAGAPRPAIPCGRVMRLSSAASGCGLAGGRAQQVDGLQRGGENRTYDDIPESECMHNYPERPGEHKLRGTAASTRGTWIHTASAWRKRIKRIKETKRIKRAEDYGMTKTNLESGRMES